MTLGTPYGVHSQSLSEFDLFQKILNALRRAQTPGTDLRIADGMKQIEDQSYSHSIVAGGFDDTS